MKFKKLAVALTVITIVNAGTPTIKVFANEMKNTDLAKTSQQESNKDETATISKFELEKYKEFQKYNEVFSINSSNIKEIKANKATHGTTKYEDMIDGNKDTYWTPSTRDIDTSKTEIEYTFDDVVTLDKITYSPRQSMPTDNCGFPEKFEIYGTTTDDGDYELVASGGGYTPTKETIEIKFKETEFKKLKFKFVEVSGKSKWAYVGEIGFYKPDSLLYNMKNLFTDSTQSVVSEEFNTIEKLDALENSVKNHVLYKNFEEDIKNAKALLAQGEIEPSKSIVSDFNLENNVEYNKVFQLDKSNIKSIKNNAGHHAEQNINNAIDGDLDTYWETNKANSNTWNNEVEVEFNEDVVFDRIVYGARPQDAKGFAQEFEIYASTTTKGDTYKLVSIGEMNTTKGMIEAKFNPTKFRRVKFKFKKSTQNWATAREFMFYKEDKLSNKVSNMFIDGTCSSLKEEYRDINKLNKLKEEANNHPLKDSLLDSINLAIEIINGNVDYTKSTIVANQHGDMSKHAKQTLSMSSAGQNLQPTGLYAIPGEKVTVYVDADKYSKHMPVLLFTQNEGKWSSWRRAVKLNPGKNEIVVPKIDTSDFITKPKLGGAIYIENPYTPEEQGKAPVIRIEGAQQYPYFKEGDNEEEFKKFLVEYKSKLDKDNESGENKVLDIVEIESDRMILAGTTTGAYESYITKGVKPSETTAFWDETMEEIFRYYGLDKSSEEHDPKYLKEHIRLAQKFGLMYAYTNHIGVQKPMMSVILEPEAVKRSSWGLIHEIGHRMDTRNRTWGEVTNNMLSIYMSHFYGYPNQRLPYETSYKKVVLDDREEAFGSGGYIESLIVFWQLELQNEGYWAKLNKLYRERKPALNSDQEKMDTIVEYSSEIFNKDLTEHFDRHLLKVSDESRKRISSKYSKLDKKTWYLNETTFRYTGNGVNKDNKVVIEEIGKDGNITISSDINKEDLLGYEIIRDGKMIGFTGLDVFKDESKDNTKEHKYEVIAYGKDLSTSSRSEEVSSLAPCIKLQQPKIHLGLGDEFKPLNYVNAWDYDDEDITKNIEVKHNVDTSKKGAYTVEYSITDQDITVKKSVEVQVSSEIEYASDVKWERATSGWKTVNKDSAVNSENKIKLKVDGKVKEFDKGIGAATDAEIVYNLEDKNFEYFTAYVGTDKNYDHNSTTIKFKILADGKEVYISDLIKKDSNAEFVKIPLSGVKELKLIADKANGNATGDFASWGDAQFISENSKPKLNVDTNIDYVKYKDEFNLMENVSAMDKEDGDITSKVVVDNNGFDVNKPGEYNVKYTITDSDNNTISKTKKVLVYSETKYASDVEWESATSGWKTVNKDSAVNSDNKIKLKVDGEIKEFDKGIGAATNAEIVYNLEGKNFEYFTAYVGTDKNYDHNSTTIKFKILADGKEVYLSDLIKKDSNAEFVQIPLSGVKELKLIADMANGNGSGDFASWGDAKFYGTNSKPVLEIEDSLTIKLGESIEDVVGKISATDAEDGDITSKISVTVPEINYNKPGKYKLVYTITDSNNNTVTKERFITIIDMKDAKPLTDFEWKSAVQSYSTTKKDINLSGNKLKLTGENGEEVVYERGIGSHANATIIYDLTDKDYEYFTSFVGVDRGMYNKASSLSFEVYVDGVKKYDSGLMLSTDSQKLVDVNISKAKELKLVVKDGGNGIGSDHATWGDPKLHFVNDERADLSKLQEVIEKAEKIEKDLYTQESILNLEKVINESKEILNLDFVSQKTCDDAIQNLETAINNLEVLNIVVSIEDEYLRRDIKETLGIDSREITLKDMYSLVSLECTSGYVKSLKGLEYAVNLESLNIDYNEVSDISVIKDLKKLKNFSGQENFISNLNDKVVIENGKVIIEDVVIDSDGERMMPTQVTLSPNTNPVKLDLSEVLVGNKVVIDSSLLDSNNSIEIVYESKNHDYQLYSFTMLF